MCRIYYILLLFVSVCCTSEHELSDLGGLVPLAVQVSNQTVTKAQVEGSSMPDGAELGLFLKEAEGADYEDGVYNNVLYTAQGSGVAQKWCVDSNTPVALTRTVGAAYAYYPRTEDVSDLTAIPITNDGTDWMYNESPATGLSNQHNVAQFRMLHAMTIVRCKLVKGNYDGSGVVRKLTVQSEALATEALLDLKTPAVYGHTGVGVELCHTDLGSLGSEALVDDFWAIPVGSAKSLRFSFLIDGKSFDWVVPSFDPVAGAVYQYTFSVDLQGLTLQTVRLCAWGEETDRPLGPEIDRSDYAVDWSEAVKEDGVYAIMPDGKALAYEYVQNRDYVGVAFTVFGKAYQVSQFYAPANDGSLTGYWSKDNLVDIPGLVNYQVVAENTFIGYLPTNDGYYYSIEKRIVGDWAIWRSWDSSRVALTDFSGKENTEKILDSQVVDGVPTANTISETLLLFRANDALNEQHDDWFIPSCGQLAFMYLFRSQLNDLMDGLGASVFDYTQVLSSSENHYKNVFIVAFTDGFVLSTPKSVPRRSRFIRKLF